MLLFVYDFPDYQDLGEDPQGALAVGDMVAIYEEYNGWYYVFPASHGSSVNGYTRTEGYVDGKYITELGDM